MSSIKRLKNLVNLQKPSGEKQIRPPPQVIAKEVEVNENQKIPRPPPERVEGDIEKIRVFGNSEKSGAQGDSGFKNPAGVYKENENDQKQDAGLAVVDNQKDVDKVVDNVKKITNETKKVVNETGNQVLKGVEQKVMAIGESVKNKTLEKLADFGMIRKKEYQKLIYEHTKWSLNLSIEDIGNIMKDTEFFQKKQNLTEMEYQPLLQPNSNVTKAINVSAIEYGLGYCDCKDLSCLCCVRVFNKRMRLNSTACATITYSSKSQVRNK